jgi:hypothetical protein
MAFAPQSIAEFTNTRFPTPDLEGAMDRRKRREQMDKQLQQQKELNDLARAEKIREFNARGVQAFGADAVVTPDGTVDYQASALNQKKRQDAELVDQAMGLRTAIEPPMVDMTKGEAGFTPEMLGALGLPNALPGEVNLEGKSPQFQAAYTKGLAEKAQNDFRLKLAKEQAVQRANLSRGNLADREKMKMEDDLRRYDKDYNPSQFTIFDEGGNAAGFDDAALRARHAEVMRKQAIIKNLPAGARAQALGDDLKSEGININLYYKTAAERNIANFEANAIKMGMPKDQILAKKNKMLQTGGRVPAIPANQDLMIGSGITAIESVDNLLGGIEEFESERNYGAGSFDRYLGLLPKKEQEIKQVLSAAKDPKDKAAYALLSQFAGMRNGNLAGVSGKTVTADENRRMSQQIGETGDKNTLLKLDQFRKDKRRETLSAVKNHIEYVIPDRYLTFFGLQPMEPVEKPSADGAPATSLPSGWQFNP